MKISWSVVMSLHALTGTRASSPISPVCVNSAFLCSVLHVWLMACALCLTPTPSTGVAYTRRLLPVSVIGIVYPRLPLPLTLPCTIRKAPNEAIHSPRWMCLVAKRPASPSSSVLGLTAAALGCSWLVQLTWLQLWHGTSSATFSTWHSCDCASVASCNGNTPAHDQLCHLSKLP